MIINYLDPQNRILFLNVLCSMLFNLFCYNMIINEKNIHKNIYKISLKLVHLAHFENHFLRVIYYIKLFSKEILFILYRNNYIPNAQCLKINKRQCRRDSLCINKHRLFFDRGKRDCAKK